MFFLNNTNTVFTNIFLGPNLKLLVVSYAPNLQFRLRGSANTCVGEQKDFLRNSKKTAFSLSISDICQSPNSTSGLFRIRHNRIKGLSSPYEIDWKFNLFHYSILQHLCWNAVPVPATTELAMKTNVCVRNVKIRWIEAKWFVGRIWWSTQAIASC